jgi:hypothetical protein
MGGGAGGWWTWMVGSFGVVGLGVAES